MTTAVMYLNWFVAFLLLLLATLSVINFLSGNKFPWFCRKMGWHKPPEKIGFDGCSANGKCPRCQKRVLQDSQGNWFTAYNQETR